VADSYFCGNGTIAIEGAYTDDGGNTVLQYCSAPEVELFGDSDGDGDVDIVDFAAFAANWLVGTD
jgi:hypothetical protein